MALITKRAGRFKTRMLWNAAANYSGRIVSAVLNVAFLPLYLRFLGPESYGLIGFFAVTQGFMQLFDLGLSTTLTGELARLSPDSNNIAKRADLIKTFESTYWLIGILISLSCCVLAPLASTHWLHTVDIPTPVLIRALVLMGFVIGANWPMSLYSGGLLGLEQHVLVNAVNGFFNVTRYAGVLLVFWLVSSDIVSYFCWQLAVSTVHVTCLRLLLWRESGCSPREGRLNFAVLRERMNLIAGIGGTYAVLVLLTNVDKLVVSRIVSLKDFGYYSIAWTAMGVFYFFYSPICATFYPSITSLCGQSFNDKAIERYELGTQITAVLVFPTAAILSVFSRETVSLWIATPETVANTHLLIRYLAPAMAVCSLVGLSNMLQWAHEWTAVGFWTNVIATILMIPVVALATPRGGIVGATLGCSLVRTIQALTQFELTHNRYLGPRKLAWYRDLALTALASGIISLGAKLLMPSAMGRFSTAFVLVITWFLTAVAVAWIPTFTRAYLVQLWSTRSLAWESAQLEPCHSAEKK